MQLTVLGSDKGTRKAVRSIVRFSANQLMSKRLSESLSIKVKLVKNLVRKEGIYGDCDADFSDTCRPKEFIIRINDVKNLKTVLSTVTHEMVHVKQYARGELHQLLNPRLFRFHDRYYHINTAYSKQPWEIEAEDYELSLYLDWKKYGQ